MTLELEPPLSSGISRDVLFEALNSYYMSQGLLSPTRARREATYVSNSLFNCLVEDKVYREELPNGLVRQTLTPQAVRDITNVDSAVRAYSDGWLHLRRGSELGPLRWGALRTVLQGLADSTGMR
ncbi:MAG: hypothetical protein UV61_C0008G0023 [Candidatus Gottesmanbacteria bacterium GW2011_GWB1_43_11]|uniref:Uncharacterized protein n=1 Tax=Candidatus Gottesmanbacteria bacterium GW2011_GWB1_43_11 TaxID=1618446 RepID=A0A0G1CL88_9BACT|nr:MAG: hypothetical protein UV04_C0003G0024 [Candidatus Gottesmanbacteria bacterium GW2011_GWA2_42_16]KKS54166.1 MAG: hypothetical protein UV17_C0025G0023 [Candidatus Gottesmanbacteria bacterium GW2011_GWA1_42_26]KKS80739.1 MAG: hypothetical protein UV55_C0031G0016 [Candidatus Gottesmanbacteria bacterium GW2011_GWC1_43_10]KKS86570.1 MAG: hypothetical protein UV61_C0008G0023 [Candidatus Gottesmanbacteria bacterium GW2011_GWB1_43_11]OGG09743.1 MAG: hypothetical protein A2699_04265 [Candidatus Go